MSDLKEKIIDETINLDSENNIAKLIKENNDFEKIRTNPKNRWFNSIMVILVSICGVCLGITLSCLLVIFL